LEQSTTLINDLGFNLCVVPQSLVVMLVIYFRVKESCQNRGPVRGTLGEAPSYTAV